MSATIVMTTFDRDQLLQLGLESIRRHNPEIPILVMNDGTLGNTQAVCDRYKAKHIFTGQRNTNEMHWRIPGFALNIGVKLADSDIIFLTCAEMWHVTDCVNPLICIIEKDPKALAIPEGKDDMSNRYLPNLDSQKHYDECVKLKTELPFLMAMRREHYINIGGYDEDFLGQSYDDDDLVDRLKLYGCHYVISKDARCVHLYHPRYCHDKRTAGRLAYNKKLYTERKDIIYRNTGKDWGCDLKAYWDGQHSGTGHKYLANSSIESYYRYLGITEVAFKDKCVLEIGVGTGNATRSIAALAKRVDALDISQVALDKLKGVIQHGYIVPGMVPFRMYDTIISFLVIQHIDDDTLLEHLRSAIQALKPDGYLYIQFADALGPVKGTVEMLKRGGGMLRKPTVVEALIKRSQGEVVNAQIHKINNNVSWHTMQVRRCQ